MGVCETFVDNVHPVTHQTCTKYILSLQVRNAFNIRNVNQHNICRARPTGEKPNIDECFNTYASY